MSGLRVDLSLRRAAFELRCDHDFPAAVSAISGPSGAGKSTLLDALCGDAPGEGSIHLGQETIADTRTRTVLPPHRRAFRRVYQDTRLFPHLNVRANVFFGHGGSSAIGVDELLETLELVPLLDRKVDALSGGERQRVALARALLSQPMRVLLLDEPISAIDRPHRRRILLALKRWQRELGVPFLHVCHNMDEALLVAEHCVRMEAGEIAAAGKPTRVLGLDSGDGEARALLLTRVDSHTPAAGLSELRWGELCIEAPLCEPAAGDEVVVELPARDVVVCTEEPGATSARNRLRAQLERIERRDAALQLAYFRVHGSPQDGPPIPCQLTPSAIADLGLTEGRECWLLFKSSALRIL